MRSGYEVGRRLHWHVLPEPQHLPALLLEGLVNATVSRLVASQLRPPVGEVGLRNVPVERAPVPEAAINEDGESLTGEGNVDVHPHAAGSTSRSLRNLKPRRCNADRRRTSALVSLRLFAFPMAVAAGDDGSG